MSTGATTATTDKTSFWSVVGTAMFANFKENFTKALGTQTFWVGVGALVISIILFGVLTALWSNTTYSSAGPFKERDYSAIPRTGSLDDYLKSKNKSASSVKMRDLTVATATLGGIQPETITHLNPYLGVVTPDAVRDQVRAGARAIIFDIWPDPADPATPVVAAMQDDSAVGGASAWWLSTGGLNRGTGRYSNWKLITRNTVRAGTMMKAAVDTAFPGSQNSQTTSQAADPFFLILILHGAMTTDYLNTLGEDLATALNGKGMAATARPGTLNTLCAATVDQFQNQKVCVIVCPDIQPGFQSLPNVNTYQQFVNVYATTKMMNYTNILETQPNTVLFSPDSLGALTQDSAQPCDASGAAPGSTVPPPQGGFCVVQPSSGRGILSTDKMYSNDGQFLGAVQTGAQFVGANLFDPTSGFLDKFFSPDLFGTYSFKLTR